MTLELRVDAAPADVYVAPERAPVKHETVDGVLVVHVPDFRTHTVLVVEDSADTP